jgi:hypothetical protein
LDFAVPNARGADTQTLAGAFHHGVNRLKVQIPATLGDIVRVANTMAELRSTTANFTDFRHVEELRARLGAQA